MLGGVGDCYSVDCCECDCSNCISWIDTKLRWLSFIVIIILDRIIIMFRLIIMNYNNNNNNNHNDKHHYVVPCRDCGKTYATSAPISIYSSSSSSSSLASPASPFHFRPLQNQDRLLQFLFVRFTCSPSSPSTNSAHHSNSMSSKNTIKSIVITRLLCSCSCRMYLY